MRSNGKYANKKKQRKGGKTAWWLALAGGVIVIGAVLALKMLPARNLDNAPVGESQNLVEATNTVTAELPEIDLQSIRPDEVTWEEYQNMSVEDRVVFPDYFESMDAFEEWYAEEKPSDSEPTVGLPDDVPAVDLQGKNPEEVTWDEYQTMTPDEQAIFPDSFESWDAYKAWYTSVCPNAE